MTAAGTELVPNLRPRALVGRILTWYATHARDLPWRRPGTSPWAVLVSELMLQQTPVARVREPWAAWLERWPTPEALAAAPAGEAVRAWGRLGYPRRALRLHAAAVAITERFDGRVPADLDALRSLPGVGSYTAAAVTSFAYGRRAVVLDTNVRRVLHRALGAGPVCMARSRLPRLDGTAPARAGVRGDGPAVPRRPARRAALDGRPRPGRRAGRGLGGRRSAHTRPRLADRRRAGHRRPPRPLRVAGLTDETGRFGPDHRPVSCLL